MKNALKRTLAGVTALTLAACATPANVGGFLTGNTGIVANAAELCIKVEVNGKTIEIDCYPYNDIKYIKELIQEKECIPPICSNLW